MPHYVVVLPLVPLTAGEGFATADWPLHVTLLPPFTIEADAAAIADALLETAPPHPVTITAAGDDWFGPHQKTLVTVVEPSPELAKFHQRAVDAVSRLGARFRIPEQLGRGYRPHVTVHRAGRVRSGDSRRLEQLAIIDLQPAEGESARVVRAVIPLTASDGGTTMNRRS